MRSTVILFSIFVILIVVIILGLSAIFPGSSIEDDKDESEKKP